MSSFKLEPADTLVNINRGADPWSVINRWAIGPYPHCLMYMGVLRLGATRYRACAGRVPMVFESYGRGASLRMLSEHYGEEVVVLRLNKYSRRIPQVLREAIRLASSPNAYYDYFCIPRSVIPRIIYEKLGIPLWLIPPTLRYQRDPYQICSEALLEIHLRARIPVLPDDIAPLPGDFPDSPLLYEVWRGKLSEVLV